MLWHTSLLPPWKPAVTTVRQFWCISQAGFQANLPHKVIFCFTKWFFGLAQGTLYPWVSTREHTWLTYTNEGMTLAESTGWWHVTQPAAPPSFCSALSSAGGCGARRLQGPAPATRSAVEMLGTRNFRNLRWCPSTRHALRAAELAWRSTICWGLHKLPQFRSRETLLWGYWLSPFGILKYIL